MNKNKKILYLLSCSALAVLLFALFIDVGSSKIVTACLLLPLTFFACVLIKKRSLLSINKREVLLLAFVTAMIYVMLKEMTGIYFKFYQNPYLINLNWLLEHVIPLAVIIVETEVLRYVMLSQKNKFVSVLTYLSCVVAEVLMFSNLAGITNFNRFMDLVGMTLFPAISANIYYHYVCKHYGALPNIVFRFITTLYIYFVPITTAMTDALSSCIKILLPIALLSFTAALFEKKKRNAVKKKGRKLGFIGIVLTVSIIASVAMLISCQFRFGALVIATESMTGEINKGDMIIYERYDGQQIKEGQVIVFLQNESKIVHRVVKIENIDGEIRYYTKGDANEDLDAGYITKGDIVGTTDIKISYIGYPTLWLREIIAN